jgi:hypothetical protein
MLDIGQFRRLVLRPTLIHLDLWSQAAENLLLGTALQESGLRHLAQMGGGPARGLYQIEPATHDDILRNYLVYRPELSGLVRTLMAPAPSPVEQSATNLAYGTAIARLVYYRRPEPLPPPDDILGLARYWKRHFNTEKGRGTVSAFVLNYKEYVDQ